MAGWRVAASLLTLRDQVNAAWPNRSRLSDGTVGDASHRARTSDHNPWITEGSMGVVSALDITHDPANGCDAGKIAASLRSSHDNRIKYIIWNRRISSSSAVDGSEPWAWRPYSGTNPHNKHVHISVKSAKSSYDSTAPWQLNAPSVVVDPLHPEVTSRPFLRRGRGGSRDAIEELQQLLNRQGAGLEVDGRFGEDTEKAVEAFQTKIGLVADGEVGSRAWAALMGAN